MPTPAPASIPAPAAFVPTLLGLLLVAALEPPDLHAQDARRAPTRVLTGDSVTLERMLRVPADQQLRVRRFHQLLEVGTLREDGLDAHRAAALIRDQGAVSAEAAGRALAAAGYPAESITEAVTAAFPISARDAQALVQGAISTLPALPSNRWRADGFEVTFCILPDGDLVHCPKNATTFPDLHFLDTSPPSGNTPPGMIPVQGGVLPRGQYGNMPPLGQTLSVGDCGSHYSWRPEENRWGLMGSGCLGDLAVESFFLSRYEVTLGEWQEVRAWAMENGYEISEGSGRSPQHPVYHISWYDAVKWSNARSEMEGLTPVYRIGGQVFRSGDLGQMDAHQVSMDRTVDGYRLPTEAEWEYAARGGELSQGFLFSGSDDPDAVAVWMNTTPMGTRPVGSKAPNELGFHDMSGNVQEWVWDATNRLFSSGVDEDLASRYFRGGSWGLDRMGVTPFYRFNNWPTWTSGTLGFRTARTVGDMGASDRTPSRGGSSRGGGSGGRR